MYFDNASTTKIDDEVISIINTSLKNDYHNPSSIYYDGRIHNEYIKEAKRDICKAINADDIKNIYFTSGGTEGNNWIIRGWIDHLIYVSKIKFKPHIITSETEHHSVLNVCKFLEQAQLATVTYLKPNLKGKICVEHVQDNIQDNTVLVSIMAVNNVLGVANDIYGIGKLCKEKNIVFHTDAVQGLGKTNINVQKDHIDFLTCSGHKIHSPKGIGFIYAKHPILLQPLLYGGLQEFGMRAGTENIPYIKALHFCINKYCNAELIIRNYIETNHIKSYLMRQLHKGFTDKEIIVGDIGTINIAFKNITADSLVWELGQQNVYVSIGSACDNGSLEPNYVLQSIYMSPEYINGNIRITFDNNNTLQECEKMIDILQATIFKLRGYL